MDLHGLPKPVASALDTVPSWLNSGGKHIDRSACFELKASVVRERVTFQSFKSKKGRSGKAVCEARGVVKVNGRILSEIRGMQQPRRVQGDTRSRRANAIETSKNSKMLGLWGQSTLDALPDAWSQRLDVERWRLNPKLAVHYLICPACKKKKRKLFLPQCRRDELDTAEMAEAWVKMLDARSSGGRGSQILSPELMKMRARVIDRFGQLFRGRQLLCNKCLGMRYGAKFRGRGTREYEKRRRGRDGGGGT